LIFKRWPQPPAKSVRLIRNPTYPSANFNKLSSKFIPEIPGNDLKQYAHPARGDKGEVSLKKIKHENVNFIWATIVAIKLGARE
jgi:hypothetical protein